MTATDQTVAPANNSPQLAVDPTDFRFVVSANRLDATISNVLCRSPGTGVRTWVGALPAPNLPAGAEKAFDAKGVLPTSSLPLRGLQGAGNEMDAFMTTPAIVDLQPALGRWPILVVALMTSPTSSMTRRSSP